MTTLENRSNTALLVIDVQNGVVGDAYERDTVVANVGTVVEKARAAEVPVVWVQHSSDNLAQGSEQWKIVPELSPDESEPLVQKRYPDSFEETTLESVLAGLAVGRLVVVGAQTDECVRSTLHGALVRGYDATLVSDAHTTEDLSPWGAPPPELVIAHTNLYWAIMRLRGERPARSKRRTSTSRPELSLPGRRRCSDRSDLGEPLDGEVVDPAGVPADGSFPCGPCLRGNVMRVVVETGGVVWQRQVEVGDVDV